MGCADHHTTRFATGLGSKNDFELWIEPNTVAEYEAFARVLELLDQG
jgi:hypothetical protein